MSLDQSVTQWMHQLADGDQQAAELIWQRYCGQLNRLANKHLHHHPRRASDEEDVALSAFHVFCQGAAGGKFPDLHDRDNLWRLLVVITARKASDHVKHERPRTPPGLRNSNDEMLQNVIGDEPTPEFAASVTEECERLLQLLNDQTLVQIAQKKLEGFTNEEIGTQLGCSLRTIERKLWRIRAEWESAGIGL